MTPYLPILDLRRRSLIRGNLLVAASVITAVFLSDFPHNRATLWLILPTLTLFAGTAETIRCIRKRWSFYHAGVILCIYMDLMAIALVLFFLLYPYYSFLSLRHLAQSSYQFTEPCLFVLVIPRGNLRLPLPYSIATPRSVAHA